MELSLNTFSENKNKNNLENKKEFKIKRSDGYYTISIIKDKDDIIFNCKKDDDLFPNYQIKLNYNEILILNEKFKSCKSNDEIYNLLIDSFEKNEIRLRQTIRNEIITLLIKSENIEINLMQTNINKDYIINKLCKSYNTFIVEIYKLQEENEELKEHNNLFMNDFNNLIKDVQYIKKENENLKNEVEGLKSFHNNQINEKDDFFTDPYKLEFGHYLTDDSYINNVLDNTFTIFKSMNNHIYLVYSTEEKNIQCLDINTKKNIKTIINPHSNNFITNIRYYYDKKNNRDLIISVSKDNNNVKIWDVKNWNCILDLKNIYNSGCLKSACIMDDLNNNYIIVSNDEEFNLIQIYDFNNIKIKEIQKSEDITYFIDTYYDIKESTYYIISGNRNVVKSFNFKENNLYKKYNEQNSKTGHLSIIIYSNNDIVKLIESDTEGYIRIWDFHEALLLNKFSVCQDIKLNGICLWNEKYLFVACNDNTIKLIILSNGDIIKKLKGHEDKVCSIKKIIHPQYGECLISQGYKKDQIKIWVYKNKEN